MQVHIELLRHTHEVRQALREDGWSLRQEPGNCLGASHPQVDDEPAARVRLHHLGLLISSWLRVEFGQTGD